MAAGSPSSDPVSPIDSKALLTLLRSAVHDILDEILEPMRVDLAEVRQAITGNGFGLSKGLVGCVDALRESDEELCIRVEALEDKWDRFKWTLTGAVLGAAFLSGGTTALVLKLVG